MSGEEFTFGGETPQKPKQEPTKKKERKPTPQRRESQKSRKPKFSQAELVQKITEFQMVTNSIHVNSVQTQRGMLENLLGSHAVADVRKWLNDKYAEALSK